MRSHEPRDFSNNRHNDAVSKLLVCLGVRDGNDESVFVCNTRCIETHEAGAFPRGEATRAFLPAATDENSEGAKCGRRAAEQLRAARGGSAAGPADRRFVSL